MSDSVWECFRKVINQDQVIQFLCNITKWVHDHHHHHHHVTLSARISLILSRHPLPIVHGFRQVFSATTRIGAELLYVCMFELVVLPLHVNLKGSTAVHHRSSSLILLFQQCPACLVRLILIVFVMGDRWPYSCCFVGCCLQD